MEERSKRKISVNVAGVAMTLITDESENFVNSVIKHVSEEMSALMNKGAKRSHLESAMMCAIGYCADKMTAEKKVRNLEAQVSLYDVNIKRLKEEIVSLKNELAEKSGNGAENNETETEAVTEEVFSESEDLNQIKINDGMPAPDPKEKIRQIEDLLRRGKREK